MKARKTTELDVVLALRDSTFPDVAISHAFFYSWESDFIRVTRSGYIHEFEIKMTRSDFTADFRKTHGWGNENKHELLAADRPMRLQYDNTYAPASVPATFTFVTVEGIVGPDQIPDHAGWMEFSPTYDSYVAVQHRKKAPRNSASKKVTTQDIGGLMRSCMFRYWQQLKEANHRESYNTTGS